MTTLRRAIRRAAPAARAVRDALDILGPALGIALFLRRPAWTDRALLALSVIGSAAARLAQEADWGGGWRTIDLGPATRLAAAGIAASAAVVDEGYGMALASFPGGQEVMLRGTGPEPPDVALRAADEEATRALVVQAAWRAAAGCARLASWGAGLSAVPARAVGAHRAGAAGDVARVRDALRPGALVLLAGPRGSQLAELARSAAACPRAAASACAAVDPRRSAELAVEAAAAARCLEVRSADLLREPGTVALAAEVLAPRVLVVHLSPEDRGATAAEAARAAALSSPGCAAVLLVDRSSAAEDVPLGPGDASMEVAPPGDVLVLRSALGCDTDDAEADAAADVLTAAAAACSAADAAAARRAASAASAARLASHPGLAEEVAEWPIGFAREALLGPSDPESLADVRMRAEGALSDYARTDESEQPSTAAPQVDAARAEA